MLPNQNANNIQTNKLIWHRWLIHNSGHKYKTSTKVHRSTLLPFLSHSWFMVESFTLIVTHFYHNEIPLHTNGLQYLFITTNSSLEINKLSESKQSCYPVKRPIRLNKLFAQVVFKLTCCWSRWRTKIANFLTINRISIELCFHAI